MKTLRALTKARSEKNLFQTELISDREFYNPIGKCLQDDSKYANEMSDSMIDPSFSDDQHEHSKIFENCREKAPKLSDDYRSLSFSQLTSLVVWNQTSPITIELECTNCTRGLGFSIAEIKVLEIYL